MENDDTRRVDFLEAFLLTGIIDAGFEIDGGIYLTLEPVGDRETVYRQQNTLREAIDEFMASQKEVRGGK